MERLPAQQTDGPYRIALVCLGNICRSPMAHVVLADHLDRAGLAAKVEVSSAGTGGWHVGKPMDPRAATALVGEGYDPSAHRARQYDPGWLSEQIGLDFHVDGFWTAVWGSIVISIASWVLGSILED